MHQNNPSENDLFSVIYGSIEDWASYGSLPCYVTPCERTQLLHLTVFVPAADK